MYILMEDPIIKEHFNNKSMTSYDNRSMPFYNNHLTISNDRSIINQRSQNFDYNRQNSRNGCRQIYLKKILFPLIDESKVNQLMIDDESIKFITFPLSAQEITNIIMNNLMDFKNSDNLAKIMKQLVITEMTAGVGGNVLNFSKYFKYVNAIELDPIRYNYLVNNVRLYGYDNVNCYNDNSISMLIDKDDITQDIIFFDPPWGGKDYKLHSNLRLNFGEYSIENVCKMLFVRPTNKMIVIKLPNNYDFEFLTSELSTYRVSNYSLDRMSIVVVKNYLDDKLATPSCNL